MKKKFSLFLRKLVGIVAFLVTSFLALFLAYGYQYDQSFRYIEKTSIIDITSRFENVQVLLDGFLESNSTPFQLKGVLPGNHLLSFHKEGFLPWKRTIKVRSDFVSRVTDLLLFPIDFKLYLKPLASFVADAHFYPADDVLIVLRRKQDYFTLITFQDDGTLKHDEISVNRPETHEVRTDTASKASSFIHNVEIFSQEKILITFEDGSYELISLGDAKFIPFRLPEGAYRLTPDFNQKALYYLVQGELYRLPFEKLQISRISPSVAGSASKNVASFKLKSQIEQFLLADNGLYYLRDGKLFYADLFGINEKELSLSLKNLTNFSYFKEGNNAFLVLRKGDQRFLYVLESSGFLRSLTRTLKGNFLLQGDKIIYMTENNDLIFYDGNSRETRFVSQVKDASLVQWFDEKGHFLYSQGDILYLSDLSFTNVFPLELEGKVTNTGEVRTSTANEASSILFIKNSALYILAENKLKVLLFNKI